MNQFITKFGAKATKASAAKSKAKALDKVQEKIEDLTELAGEGDLGEGPGDAKKVVLRLPNPPQGAREILIAKDLAVGYAAVGSTLVTDVNVTVTKGDRLLVIGPNGAGKSTFLKTIGGELPEMSGTVERGEGCVVGYFSQDLAQQLPAEVDALTHVLDVARKVDKSITMERARGVLGALGITGSAAVDRTIGSLSGGEKARVALAAFVLKPVNVLLLDEASNHLDGTAIEALCDGLRGWEGAVIAITHNPAFAAALNPTIVAKVENGAFSARMRVAGDELGVGDYAARAPPTERPPSPPPPTPPTPRRRTSPQIPSRDGERGRQRPQNHRQNRARARRPRRPNRRARRRPRRRRRRRRSRPRSSAPKGRKARQAGASITTSGSVSSPSSLASPPSTPSSSARARARRRRQTPAPKMKRSSETPTDASRSRASTARFRRAIDRHAIDTRRVDKTATPDVALDALERDDARATETRDDRQRVSVS